MEFLTHAKGNSYKPKFLMKSVIHKKPFKDRVPTSKGAYGMPLALHFPMHLDRTPEFLRTHKAGGNSLSCLMR